MTFNETLSQRYSCRDYSDRPVDRRLLGEILEAARLAPSACNRQPWRFIVIDRPDDTAGREAVTAAYGRPWIATAPAYIIACGLPAEGWTRPFDEHSHIDVDIAIAVEHLCLSATEHGLATCWVCNFDPAVLRGKLGLDDKLTPVAILPVGYPASDKIPAKNRKQPEEIITWRD